MSFSYEEIPKSYLKVVFGHMLILMFSYMTKTEIRPKQMERKQSHRHQLGSEVQLSSTPFSSFSLPASIPNLKGIASSLSYEHKKVFKEGRLGLMILEGHGRQFPLPLGGMFSGHAQSGSNTSLPSGQGCEDAIGLIVYRACIQNC